MTSPYDPSPTTPNVAGQDYWLIDEYATRPRADPPRDPGHREEPPGFWDVLGAAGIGVAIALLLGAALVILVAPACACLTR